MSPHFLFLVVFCVAVGMVLGPMLRRDLREGARLATWIAGGMIFAALLLSWGMYLLTG